MSPALHIQGHRHNWTLLSLKKKDIQYLLGAYNGTVLRDSHVCVDSFQQPPVSYPSQSHRRDAWVQNCSDGLRPHSHQHSARESGLLGSKSQDSSIYEPLSDWHTVFFTLFISSAGLLIYFVISLFGWRATILEVTLGASAPNEPDLIPLDVWHSGSGALPPKVMFLLPGHPASLHPDWLLEPTRDPQPPGIMLFHRSHSCMCGNQELTQFQHTAFTHLNGYTFKHIYVQKGSILALEVFYFNKKGTGNIH